MKDDSVDVVALLAKVYKGRKKIIIWSSIFFALGLTVALITPNKFIAGSTFIPLSGSSELGATSGLSSLASIAGINIGSKSNDSEIPPSLYPRIVESVLFRNALLKEEVILDSGPVSLADYLLFDDSQNHLLLTIEEYTIGLPGTLFRLIRGSSETGEELVQKDTIYQMTKRDKTLYTILSERLTLSLNVEEGFVKLEFSDYNRQIAAQVAQRATFLLQERIIEFKNQSAKDLLNYAQGRYKEHKVAHNELEDSVALFRDRNLNISTAYSQNSLDRLQRELSVSSTVLEQLASQVEQAKLQVNKDTPVFMMIEPVYIPFLKSSPRRGVVVVFWTFLGLSFSVIYLIAGAPAREIFRNIKKGSS